MIIVDNVVVSEKKIKQLNKHAGLSACKQKNISTYKPPLSPGKSIITFCLCNFHKHCYIAALHSSYKSLRYKRLHLENFLKPLAKIQKPKAYKRQFKEFWLPKKSSTDASRIANSFEIYKNHLQ